jgi:hypothetical protein
MSGHGDPAGREDRILVGCGVPEKQVGSPGDEKNDDEDNDY